MSKSKGVGFAVGHPVWVSSRRGGDGDGGDVVDSVNHPPHYTQHEGFEVWDILDVFFPNDPHKWAAGKYLLRAGMKGSEVEDLRKCISFINRRIKALEGDK